MGIGKDKLTYDPTDANSLAASDTIGAYTLDGSGTRITSTVVSGKTGLDVNVISTIAVDLDGFYVLATNPTPDTVGQILRTRGAAPGLSAQVEPLTAATAASDAVVAANVHGQDVNSFGMVYNGTTWDRLTGTGGAVNVAQSTSPWVVSGTVTSNQGTSPWVVSDAALANTALLSSKKSVTTTAAAILAAQQANRKYLTFQNLGGSNVFIGGSAVDATTGLRLSNGAMLEGLRLGPALSVFALTSAGTGDLRILEAS